MPSGFRPRSARLIGLVLLCWTPLASSQQPVDCKRACESNYWKGVSECHRTNTLYNDIRRCQDGEEADKRKCTDRCARPKSQEPGDCAKRCDRDYWDSISDCYQASNRYREIRGCEDLAREAKDKCRRACSEPPKGGRPIAFP